MEKNILTKEQINKLKRAKGLIKSVVQDVATSKGNDPKSFMQHFTGTPAGNFVECMTDDVLNTLDAAIKNQF